MSFDVWTTAVANRQLQALRNVTRANAKRAMDDLERRGCEAAHYRLEGEEVDRFCVLPLGGNWRMIVAFPASTEVAIVLVGQHLENSSQLDVYQRLYRNLGIELPTVKQRKNHPPCCPARERAPVDPDLVNNFIAREKDLRREDRGRRKRKK